MTENGNNFIDFSTPKLMGILNLSHDSFFDGGKYNNKEKITQQCEKMLTEGADIIDIGANSSRPGSTPISEKKELELLIPTINLLKKISNNIIISIDTFRASVAAKCLENNVDIINDISAGELDKKMFNVIAKYQPYYVITHMQGNPTNMQNSPSYKNVTKDIYMFLKEKIRRLGDMGIEKIIIDPGFGFGKTLNHNYTLLKKLKEFQKLNIPILIGVSRKSMIYKLLDCSAKEALNGTTAIHSIAIENGANILRAHDVKEAKEVISIFNFMKDLG